MLIFKAAIIDFTWGQCSNLLTLQLLHYMVSQQTGSIWQQKAKVSTVKLQVEQRSAGFFFFFSFPGAEIIQIEIRPISHSQPILSFDVEIKR